MATYSHVNIPMPEAKRLSDLIGIKHDLEEAKEYTEICIQLSEPDKEPTRSNPDAKHLKCFTNYVFIKYARCFKGGVRKNVTKELIEAKNLNNNNQHNLAIELRDGYIAHSVNDLETYQVCVWLNPEEHGRRINNVNMGFSVLFSLNKETMCNLSEHINELLAWLNTEIRDEEIRLQEIVEEQYTLNQIYACDAKPHNPIRLENLKKSRRAPN